MAILMATGVRKWTERIIRCICVKRLTQKIRWGALAKQSWKSRREFILDAHLFSLSLRCSVLNIRPMLGVKFTCTAIFVCERSDIIALISQKVGKKYLIETIRSTNGWKIMRLQQCFNCSHFIAFQKELFASARVSETWRGGGRRPYCKWPKSWMWPFQRNYPAATHYVKAL